MSSFALKKRGLNSARRSLSVLFFFLLISLIYVTFGNLLAGAGRIVPFRDQLKMAMSAVGLCVLLRLSCRADLVFGKDMLGLLLVFGIVILVPTCFYYLSGYVSFQYGLLQISLSILWIAVFALSYWSGYKNPFLLERLGWMGLAVPIVFVLFAGVRTHINEIGWTESVTMAYYALFLLPFVLLLHNKTIRWVFVAIIFATLLLSSKRGGFIAFFLALIVYAVVEWQMAGKGDPKRVLLILGSVILAMAFYYFFTSFTKANNLAMLDRLENLANDDGSGRPDVWACVWRMILASDPMSLLIGHGFNTVYRASPMGLSAHNDFLEVIYDYGLIGFLLYLRLYYHVWQLYLRVKSDCSQLAPAFAASLVLMIFMSCMAHLIIYPTHFLLLCMFWGVIAGYLKSKGSVSPRGYM